MDRRYAYGAGIGVVGAVLAIIQVVHGIEQTDRALVLAFETGPFVLLALALVFTGGWLAVRGEYHDGWPRIAAWGVGSSVLFASIAALMLFSQQIGLGTLERAPYIAIDLVTVGALVGTLVGLYDARGQQRLRDLQRERDRVETFAEKAADVNNYGRALTRSHSIDEVSALVIEAMNTLLGVSESAVLVGDGEYETLDSTLVGLDDGALATLADRAREGDEGVLITHNGMPGEGGQDATPLSLLLHREDGRTVVLVALDDTGEIPDEDIELVEMLASHASTALAGIALSGRDGPPTTPF